ncbi:5'-nucleotidase-like [Ischnura elegans]|uniref:5'-nucleotidase-like n=1 Tax=Ischnura elegans TaxID=197161 RepID=UPI001ED890F2|nr:5'-nucleotidase-like [Ischnura elegans]
MTLLFRTRHLILPLLLSLVIATRGDSDTFTLKIFFVNDMNYGFFPVNGTDGNSCKNASDSVCRGGLARLSQLKNATASRNSQSSSIEGYGGAVSQSDQIWLNAGNFLGENNEWFDLLKFQPAIDAINYLKFDAVAIGSEVFQYGRKAASNLISSLKGDGCALNVESLDETVAPSKPRTIKFGDYTVTIIGFLDMEGMRGKDGTGFNIDDECYAIENFIINSKKINNSTKSIYIAIGNVKTLERAQRMAQIKGLDILIFSGHNVSDVKYVNGTFMESYGQTSWLISTQPPNETEYHHILGEITLAVTEKGKTVTLRTHDYSSFNRSDDKQIMKFETEGLAHLNSLKYESMAITKSLIDRDDCSKKECLLGNLVTNAMLAPFDGIDGQMVDAAIWNQGLSPSKKIDANASLTEEDLHAALGFPDESIYTITIPFNKFICYLESSLSSTKIGEHPFMQLSGLFVEYEADGDKKWKITAVKGVGADMRLEYLNMSSEENITIAMPAHLLLYTFDLARFDDAEDTGVTVAGALADFARRSSSPHKILRPPLLGLRFTLVEEPGFFKCLNNTAEAVLLTLTAVVVLMAGALLVWFVVIPRIRSRRGSTTRLLD